MAEATEQYVTIENCKIQYLRGGKGPTVLFLHGGGGAGIWFPFFNALSDQYDVVMPEHPSFGRSDTPPWLDNIGDLSNFYFEFIKKLGLKDIHLIGNSLGGWLAADMVVRNSTPFRSLTLITAAGIHLNDVPKGDIFLWSPEQLMRNLFHNQAIPEALLKAPVNEEERRRQMKNSLSLAKLAWQPRLHDPHLQKWVHRIDIPTLVLWGDDDKLIPPGHAPAWRDLIPGAKMEIIKDCGHVPHLEKSDESLAAITKHLAAAKA